MSIKYDSVREPFAEIIKKATINATYVIPDLQRECESDTRCLDSEGTHGVHLRQ